MNMVKKVLSNEAGNEVAIQEKKTDKQRSPKLMQTNVPSHSLEDALSVPQAIWDNLAGKPSSPLQVSAALDLSPSSSKWRDLAGASIAYGLTSGGWNAKQISIEPIGKRAIAPTQDGDDSIAIREAVLKPSILKRFFEYYDGKKFPKDNIAENILVEWGVPKERASKVLALIKENGYFAGMLTEIKGSQYISIGSTTTITDADQDIDSATEETQEEDSALPTELLERLDLSKKTEGLNAPSSIPVDKTHSNNKVFISHGKNRSMVENLKELLIFGSFEPVVSTERETTAIPVPEKVFSDMRECHAGIIHVEEERSFIDTEGNPHKMLNENVLIEIGAAIALYGDRIILLCQRDITLPSNLQGLYRCNYDGDKLDYDATMKLLKTFNSFKVAK